MSVLFIFEKRNLYVKFVTKLLVTMGVSLFTLKQFIKVIKRKFVNFAKKQDLDRQIMAVHLSLFAKKVFPTDVI